MPVAEDLPVAEDGADDLLACTSRLAWSFVGAGGLVVYVFNEFSPWDFPANLFRRDAAIRGKPAKMVGLQGVYRSDIDVLRCIAIRGLSR
jgi:hypothetical protein